MDWLPIIAMFVIGALVGSFLNMLIYRLPREESILSPRSHCPHCKTIIPLNLPETPFPTHTNFATRVTNLYWSHFSNFFS